MSAATPPKLMTAEEFFALPDDGVERWLIDGVLRESGAAVTKRNKNHARTEARIAFLLKRWLTDSPQPRGEVYSGEIGVQLSRDPDVIVAIDVAYFSDAVVESSRDEAYMEGPPVLAVEILSPYDTQREPHEKLVRYQSSGTPLVWVVDPDLRTDVVHRQGAMPVMFNDEQTIEGGDALPGLSVPVSKLFGR